VLCLDPLTLASSTVKDLVAGSGIVFEDRGAHQLKGIPGEWRSKSRSRLRRPANPGDLAIE
jgi:hypothetical protein